MAFGFGKKKQVSEEDSFFNDLGIDDNFLSDEKKKKGASYLFDNLVKVAVGKKQMFAIIGYVFFGFAIVVGVGGMIMINASIDKQQLILDNNNTHLEELGSEIAELEKIKKQGNIISAKDKNAIIKRISNDRIPWGDVLSKIKTLFSSLQSRSIYVDIESYIFDAEHNTINITGKTSNYNSYAQIIDIIESQEEFSEVEFKGAQIEEDIVPIKLVFKYIPISQRIVDGGEQ